MNTLIKNGTLITASETFEADILIEDEKISLIGKNLQHPNAEIIDASEKLIMPGGIDPHTHFDLPMFGTVSSDDHYTGHKAAAFGGTTTVMDFVVQNPPSPPASPPAGEGSSSLPLGEGLGVRERGGFRHDVDLWLQKSQKA